MAKTADVESKQDAKAGQEEKNRNVPEINGPALPDQMFDIGIKWSADMAQIVAADTFVGDDGETGAYMKMKMFGSFETLSIEPSEVPVFEQFLDKMIRVDKCDFDVEHKKNGETKLRFHLDPEKVTVLG